MAFAWDPYASLGLFTILFGWGLGVFVFVTAPHRLANRALALLLIAESTAVGIARGVRYLVEPTLWVHGLAGVGAMLMIVNLVAYLFFLSTVDSPLTRPLRNRVVRILVVAGGVLWWAYAMWSPAPMWPTVYLANFQAWVWVGVFGLVVAITTWHRAPRGSPRRRQARAYAIAFGWRDAVWFGYLHLGIPVWVQGESGGVFANEGLFFAVFAPAITIVFVLLLAYGMLRTQLFDIELKLKWTIRKSTLVGIFVGVFFISAQVAQAFLTTEYGWWVGGVVAGCLLLAINPLQRFAAHVADAAIPGVEDSPEYKAFRKLEVYKGAVEELLLDGRITEKERAALDGLARRLGVDAGAAAAVERDVHSARAGARPVAAGRPGPK